MAGDTDPQREPLDGEPPFFYDAEDYLEPVAPPSHAEGAELAPQAEGQAEPHAAPARDSLMAAAAPKAISQNGWAVNPPTLVSFPWITGRVLGGDVYTVLDYVAKRWNATVEKINKSWSWGYDPRPIKGSTQISNHSSGTAVDFNAPKHPLGAVGTFTTKQRAALRKISDDCGGVVRFGEFYSGRRDGMHAEINASKARVAALAAKIRAGDMPGLTPPWKPNPKVVTELAKVQKQFQITQGAAHGVIQRFHGIGNIQVALNKRYDAGLVVDGYAGRKTVAAWKAHERKVGGTGRAGTPDAVSLKTLGVKFKA